MRRPSSLALVLAAGLFITPVAAHHSFTTMYLEQDLLEIEGEIVEFQYQNPHSWVHVNAEDPFGRRRTYAVEWTSRAGLESDGIKKDTLRPGDRVRIWASPNRNPSDSRIRLRRIERRDGWQWGRLERRDER